MLKVFLFLVLNFLALGVGGIFTGKGVPSDWYIQLDKAPWTPPGWVFGFAWTTIMVCFSFYMANLLNKGGAVKTIILLYTVQWILNVIWNPIFFYYHYTGIGLIVIVALLIVVAVFLFKYLGFSKLNALLILPYFLWLIIATSLNAYIVFKN